MFLHTEYSVEGTVSPVYLPSPASLMEASTLITDDKSTEELQKQFGELLDENDILKDTLKKNYMSMKEQFLMIASCQEDMMEAHILQKEKFNETRDLVDKLRQEKKMLIMGIGCLANSEISANTNKSLECSSELGPMSAIEFVTSPDDDIINKLVEKRRQLRHEKKILNPDMARLAGSETPKLANSTHTNKSSECSSDLMAAPEFVTTTDNDPINKLNAQLELAEKHRRHVRQTGTATATAVAGSGQTVTRTASAGGGSIATATATAGPGATATATATVGPGATADATATAEAGSRAIATSIATRGAGERATATANARMGAIAEAAATARDGGTATATATAEPGARAISTSIASGGAGTRASATSTAAMGGIATAEASAIASANAPPTATETKTAASSATATARATRTATATATAQ